MDPWKELKMEVSWADWMVLLMAIWNDLWMVTMKDDEMDK